MNNESSASSLEEKEKENTQYNEVLESIRAFKESRKAREEELEHFGSMKSKLKNMGYDSARDAIAAMVYSNH